MTRNFGKSRTKRGFPGVELITFPVNPRILLPSTGQTFSDPCIFAPAKLGIGQMLVYEIWKALCFELSFSDIGGSH